MADPIRHGSFVFCPKPGCHALMQALPDGVGVQACDPAEEQQRKLEEQEEAEALDAQSSADGAAREQSKHTGAREAPQDAGKQAGGKKKAGGKRNASTAERKKRPKKRSGTNADDRPDVAQTLMYECRLCRQRLPATWLATAGDQSNAPPAMVVHQTGGEEGLRVF